MTNIFNKKEIPIVFAVDDNYAPFLCVSVKSIIENATMDYFYKIYVLNTGISETNRKLLSGMVDGYDANLSVEFIDVADRMRTLSGKLRLRDYYNNTIFYRIFIPSLFPNYEKILYIDSDIVFVDDVSKLFDTDLTGCVLGVTKDEIVPAIEGFADYVEDFLGVDRYSYFNSGMLLFNTEEYKKTQMERKFIEYMLKYKFEIAPDQDCLNVLCQGKIKYIDPNWNKTPMPELISDVKDLKAIHFKMKFRPWKYDDVLCQDVFWKYAKGTPYYKDLIKMRKKTTQQDKRNDEIGFVRLIKMAQDLIHSENNFVKLQSENA